MDIQCASRESLFNQLASICGKICSTEVTSSFILRREKTFQFEKTEVFYLTASSLGFSWKPGMRNFVDVDLWGEALSLEVICTKHLHHLSFSENLKSFHQNQSTGMVDQNIQSKSLYIIYYKTKVLKTMEASETIELIFFFRCSLLLFSWYAQATEHVFTYLIRIFCMVREVRRRCLSLASWDRFADKYKHILLDRHARRNCSGKVLETLTCLARSKTFCQKAHRLTQSRKVGGQLLRARGYPYEIKTRQTSFDRTLAQFCFENTK